MASIGNIFKKLSGVNSDNTPSDIKKISPSERELMVFKEQERQDNIKMELEGFRKKNTLLNDNQGMHRSILKTAPEQSIFNQGQKSSNIGGKKKNQRNTMSLEE